MHARVPVLRFKDDVVLFDGVPDPAGSERTFNARRRVVGKNQHEEMIVTHRSAGVHADCKSETFERTAVPDVNLAIPQQDLLVDSEDIRFPNRFALMLDERANDDLVPEQLDSARPRGPANRRGWKDEGDRQQSRRCRQSKLLGP